MEQEYVICSESLTKRFKKFTAVDNVNIHVPKGSIYGFIGKNGAGKSTCMKMFSGMIKPTSGNIKLLGASGEEIYTSHVLKNVGTLIESPGLYLNMTGFDNLKALSFVVGNVTDDDIKSVMQEVGLNWDDPKKVKGYSLGMKQRLGIGMALLGKPELLILDEPINGLDPQGIAEVRNLLTELNSKKGMTIMISSHILEELSKLATHIGIINDGKMLAEFTKDEFEKMDKPKIELAVSDNSKTVEILKELNINNVKIETDGRIIISDCAMQTGELIGKIVGAGINVNSINEKRTSLEDYYLELTDNQTKNK